MPESKTVDWNQHRYGPGVLCEFTPRAEYKGRCMKPGLSEKAGLRLTLNALWLMTDDDPYPGEYALAVLTPLGSMMAQLGLSWIASGDVTPVQL